MYRRAGRLRVALPGARGQLAGVVLHILLRGREGVVEGEGGGGEEEGYHPYLKYWLDWSRKDLRSTSVYCFQ
jgi:hypothetical protein